MKNDTVLSTEKTRNSVTLWKLIIFLFVLRQNASANVVGNTKQYVT